MTISKTLLFIGTLAGLTACAISTNPMDNYPKAIAVKAKQAIFKNYSEKEVRKYLKDDYIQHNPSIASGIEPIVELLPNLKKAQTSFVTHRILQDGDFVVMHNSVTNAETLGAEELVSFDIFRIEGNKVAEHWDAVTPKVYQTASGRSQTDGPTKVVDRHKTEQNKQLIVELVNEVFIKGNANTITNYISTEQYDQHNPMVKDGLSGLVDAIEYLSSQNNMFIYNKVHKVLGEGNFVLVQVEGKWNGKPHVFFDLFRVENDKVVEHWDVVNEIPEQLAHNNGVF